MQLELSDAELGFVRLALAKVDPTQIMGEAVSIQQKIQAYVEEVQKRQMDEASKPVPEPVDD